MSAAGGAALIGGTGVAAIGGNDANTLVLITGNGADTSTTLTNSAVGSSTTFSAQGDAQVDTAQSVFGGASVLLDGTGDYLLGSAGTNWIFNTTGNPWTFDWRQRFASVAASQAFFTQGNTSFAIGWDMTNLVVRMDNGSTLVNFAWAPSADVWYRVYVQRDASDNISAYVDGSQIGTTQSLALNNGVNVLEIGRHGGGTYGSLNGWMEEIRVSNVARGEGMTVPAGPYTT